MFDISLPKFIVIDGIFYKYLNYEQQSPPL
jgi:hypothetical protein